jgi:hypothetical protein
MVDDIDGAGSTVDQVCGLKKMILLSANRSMIQEQEERSN